jgi:hypothetical protein
VPQAVQNPASLVLGELSAAGSPGSAGPLLACVIGVIPWDGNRTFPASHYDSISYPELEHLSGIKHRAARQAGGRGPLAKMANDL